MSLQAAYVALAGGWIGATVSCWAFLLWWRYR